MYILYCVYACWYVSVRVFLFTLSHFRYNNIRLALLLPWAQILTQEDWNVVLFNGMEKTSHWAALYFVALMTFGNYVLFNLLVAILVEGFSSEVKDLHHALFN